MTRSHVSVTIAGSENDKEIEEYRQSVERILSKEFDRMFVELMVFGSVVIQLPEEPPK